MLTSDPIHHVAVRLMRAGQLAAVVLALAVAAPVTTQAAGGKQMPFKSPEAAYEQGMSAWKTGSFDIALPALRFAAEHDVFLAQFYLARLYADSSTHYTDQAAAYRIYQKIGNDYADIDPDDDQRAPFVAKALTALAGYVRDGLSQIDLKSDPVRAVEILEHAAKVFNGEDAQFELAKLYLKGDAVAADPRTAMHWLSVLTQRGHAGAQAFLADIYWRGRYNIPRDQLKAFALITVAVENASDTERIWIEDIYQNIYCGASAGTRNQAQPMVSDWRKKYSRTVIPSERYGLGVLPPKADRSCGNGEPVAPLARTIDRGTPSPQGLGFSGAGMLGIGITNSQPAGR